MGCKFISLNKYSPPDRKLYRCILLLVSVAGFIIIVASQENAKISAPSFVQHDSSSNNEYVTKIDVEIYTGKILHGNNIPMLARPRQETDVATSTGKGKGPRQESDVASYWGKVKGPRQERDVASYWGKVKGPRQERDVASYSGKVTARIRKDKRVEYNTLVEILFEMKNIKNQDGFIYKDESILFHINISTSAIAPGYSKEDYVASFEKSYQLLLKIRNFTKTDDGTYSYSSSKYTSNKLTVNATASYSSATKIHHWKTAFLVIFVLLVNWLFI